MYVYRHQPGAHLCFLTVENTHISKVLVQQLHVSVQHFQGEQLVVVVVQTRAEVQTGVPAGSEDKKGAFTCIYINIPHLFCCSVAVFVFPPPFYGNLIRQDDQEAVLFPLSLSWVHLWPSLPFTVRLLSTCCYLCGTHKHKQPRLFPDM